MNNNRQDNVSPLFLNPTLTDAFAALTDKPCRFVEVINNSGVNLVCDRGSGTTTFTLPTGNSHIFKVARTASELRMKVSSGTYAAPIEIWG